MSVLEKLRNMLSRADSAMDQEQSVLNSIDPPVQAALVRLYARDPGLKPFLRKAHAYVVFPAIGRAAAVIGGAFGKGEVFRQDNLIGYAAVGQLTLGVQLGGQTLTQIIAFETPQVLARFKQNRLRFAANASAVLVKAGAAASARYEKGAAVFVHSEGGMMLELAIGAQKFVFKPAAMGRLSESATNAEKSGTTPSRRAPVKAGRKSPKKKPLQKKSAKPKSAKKTSKTPASSRNKTRRSPASSSKR